MDFSLNALFQTVLIILVFLVLGKLVTMFAQKVLTKWAAKTETDLDDLVIAKIKPPFSYVVWFLGIRVALAPLNLEIPLVDKILDTIILAIIFYAISIIVDVVVKGVLHRIAARTQGTLDDTLMPLINKTINVVFVIVAIMWILGVWDVDLTPLVASLGVAGLALSFALKDSLGNIFGGISIILDQTIAVGDKVMLESGQTGRIHEIGLRATRMKTPDNEMVIIPNGQLANSRIQNFAKPSLAQRVVVDFGVHYDSEVDLVRKIVYDAIMTIDDIDQDEKAPEVLFVNMGDSSLDFSARFWIEDYSDEWEKQLEATDKIFAALKANNIDIPYPTRTILKG